MVSQKQFDQKTKKANGITSITRVKLHEPHVGQSNNW